jgi:hypothetical protein
MRYQRWLTELSAVMVITGCSAGGIEVRTTAVPDANLTQLRTFRVLDAPERRSDAPQLPSDDPMLANSITNQRLRMGLVQQFQQHGYIQAVENADFLVAYYAGTREKHDTSYWETDPYWNYGYWGYGRRRATFRSAWPWYGPDAPSPGLRVREYTQGCVIVDVIDARTMELVWRGQAVAVVSNNPEKYIREIDQSVVSIMAKFPSVVPVAGGLD